MLPKNCWCCCSSSDVDKKSYRLLNSAAFVELALNWQKPRFSADWWWLIIERERRKAERQSICPKLHKAIWTLSCWLRFMTHQSDTCFFSFSSENTGSDHRIKWQMTDTSRRIPMPYRQNISCVCSQGKCWLQRYFCNMETCKSQTVYNKLQLYVYFVSISLNISLFEIWWVGGWMDCQV